MEICRGATRQAVLIAIQAVIEIKNEQNSPLLPIDQSTQLEKIDDLPRGAHSRKGPQSYRKMICDRALLCRPP